MCDVTVAVCTRNRADRLRVALASLAGLEMPASVRHEILVVDNGSTDDTPAAVEEFAAVASVPVRRVFEPEPGIVPARNRSVEECRGRWLASFDDDQVASPNWLAGLLEMAGRKSCGFVGGRTELRLPEGVDRDLDPVTRMLLGESVGMTEPRRFTPTVTPSTNSLIVERRLFDEVGLFDPAYHQRGEDTDLALRLMAAGHEGWYTPDSVVTHVIPTDRLTDEYLFKLTDLMGEGMAEAERDTRGRLLFPAVYAARVGQAVLRLWPRWAVARLRGDAEAALGARCRLRIARRYLRDGAGLLLGRGRDHATPAAGGV